MTDKDPLGWMKAPLPPLQGGIVTIHSTDAKKHVENRRRSYSVSDSLIPNSTGPKPARKSLNKSEQTSKKEYDQMKILYNSKPPTIPEPSFGFYRPPPIEETAAHLKKNFPLPTIPTNTPLSKSLSSKDATLGLTEQVNLAISSLENDVADNNITELDFLEKKSQIYAATMNKIILKEREIHPDKALLLRNIQVFYNELVPNIDKIKGTFSETEKSLSSQILELKENLDKITSKNFDYSQKIEELNQVVKALNEKLETIEKESNDKDILIRDYQLRIEIIESETNTLKFKNMKLEEKTKNQDEIINIMQAENKSANSQNEEVNKLIAQYQEGETGYIVQYHEEKQKNAALQKTIDNLNQEIFNITNIPKSDISVDTADLPQQRMLRKGKRERRSSNICGTPSPTSSAKNLPELIDVEVQTVEQSFKAPRLASFMSVPRMMDDQILPAITDTSLQPYQEKLPPSLEERGYNIDHSKLSTLPEIFSFIIPMLCQPYIEAMPVELNILSEEYTKNIEKSQKPLIWLLRIINDFLMDPWTRSLDNERYPTIESMFTSWVEIQYKVKHLVNQTIADIAFGIKQYEATDTVVEFFSDILQSKLSVGQLAFVATIHSFAVGYTFPDLGQTLANMSSATYIEPPRIHVACCEAILAKCFTEAVAKIAMEGYGTPDNPLIPYIDFLRICASIFDQKHKLIFTQARDLFWMCGCPDPHRVQHEEFGRFMYALDFGSLTKEMWDQLIRNKQSKKVDYADILIHCAERRDPFVAIMNMRPLNHTVARLTQSPPEDCFLYHEFASRAADSIPRIVERIPPGLRATIGECEKELREGVLIGDVGRVLFAYKSVVTEVDRVATELAQQIPYRSIGKEGTIDYFNQLEACCFALVP